LQDDKYIIAIKDSLKIFLKTTSRRPIITDTSSMEKISKIQDEAIDPNLMISNEISIEVRSSYETKQFDNLMKENNLIMLELEKLIIDMVNYNKKVCETIDYEFVAESVPIFFKCPITWEKMEYPVVSSEGHR
jgi:hypothetical protein